MRRTTFYSNFYTYMSLPLLAVVVPAIVMLAWYVNKTHGRRTHDQAASAGALRAFAANRYKTAVVVMLFMLHNKISKVRTGLRVAWHCCWSCPDECVRMLPTRQVVFSVFKQYKLPVNGHHVLQANLNVETSGGQYSAAFVVGIAGAVVYAVGIPGVFNVSTRRRCA
jgi:hypothetical protein